MSSHAETNPESPGARAFCYRCHKPGVLCLCATIPRVAHRTRVVVLQHPRERAHPIGTARFVELGLERGEVHVAHGLHRELALGADAAVLFPHETATDLAELGPDERPSTLVVLDGTWPQARTLYRANPWLGELRHVRLAPDAPSRYRIRREPSEDYVSTLESIVLALRILEPEVSGLDELLAAFDGMIDAQIAAHASGGGVRRRRRLPVRDFLGVPRALGERFDDLVLVYPEWSKPRRVGDLRTATLLQWAAVRAASGELFERLIAPPPALAASEFALTGLAPEALRSANDESSAFEALRAFVGDRGIVAAFSPATTARIASVLERESLSLRAAYRSVREGADGGLDAAVAREGLRVAPLPLHGRASTRLAAALELARFLHRTADARANARRAATSDTGAAIASS